MQPERGWINPDKPERFNVAIQRFLAIANEEEAEKAHQSIIPIETSQMQCNGVNFHCCMSRVSEPHIPWGPTGPGDENRSDS
jgi:hypothetical protein